MYDASDWIKKCLNCEDSQFTKSLLEESQQGDGLTKKNTQMEESCSSSGNHPTTVNLFRGSRAMALYRLYHSTPAKADLSTLNSKRYALFKECMQLSVRITQAH